jgi:hypothetical protein
MRAMTPPPDRARHPGIDLLRGLSLLLLVALPCGLALGGAPHDVLDKLQRTLPRAALAALGQHVRWDESATGDLPALVASASPTPTRGIPKEASA